MTAAAMIPAAPGWRAARFCDAVFGMARGEGYLGDREAASDERVPAAFLHRGDAPNADFACGYGAQSWQEYPLADAIARPGGDQHAVMPSCIRGRPQGSSVLPFFGPVWAGDSEGRQAARTTRGPRR